jgi:hypothetical protein
MHIRAPSSNGGGVNFNLYHLHMAVVGKNTSQSQQTWLPDLVLHGDFDADFALISLSAVFA